MAYLKDFDTPEHCQYAYDCLGFIASSGALLSQACVGQARVNNFSTWILEDYSVHVNKFIEVDTHIGFRLWMGSCEIVFKIILSENLSTLYGHLQYHCQNEFIEKTPLSFEEAKSVFIGLIDDIRSRQPKTRRSSAPVALKSYKSMKNITRLKTKRMSVL